MAAPKKRRPTKKPAAKGHASAVTHRKKSAFLAAYRELGNIRLAAEAAGIHRGTHYEWLDGDPEYVTQFADAGDDAADLLEAEARRRAVEGVEEPVGWHQGVAGGTVRRYSDTLLIFSLKGIRPERYSDQHALEARLQTLVEVTAWALSILHSCSSVTVTPAAHRPNGSRTSRPQPQSSIVCSEGRPIARPARCPLS